MSSKKKAVVAVVRHEGKILMGKKKKSDKKMMSGKWHIPGETLEVGETDEQGLVRGMMEEASIEVKPGKYIGSHISSTGKLVKWDECTPLTTDVVAGSDLEEIAWIPFEKVLDICQKRITSLWPQEALEYFQDKRKV